MKAYKVTGYIIDIEDVGPINLKHEIQQMDYATISGLKLEEAEIGEWSDDHPLNKRGCDYEPYFKLKGGKG